VRQPDYDKAVRTALNLLDRNAITAPPVRVDDILDDENIRLVARALPEDMRNVSGYVDVSGSTIYVNAADAPNRQTFTIAHELGHLLMHRDEVANDPRYAVLMRKPIGPNETDPIEKEANCFAASLLVPAEFLNPYRDLDAERLSRIFVVSTEVIRHRLAKLDEDLRRVARIRREEGTSVAA
jgi:Zn-dependent peptidase ImmA (M78 family)